MDNTSKTFYERLLAVYEFLLIISTCSSHSARNIEQYINITTDKPIIWHGNFKTITVGNDIIKYLFTANSYGDDAYRLRSSIILQIIERALRLTAIDAILADLA